MRSYRPVSLSGGGVDFVALFMTAVHLILVWEERDDPNLLRHAQRQKSGGASGRRLRGVIRSQRVVHYAWEAAGRPVHGIGT